MANQITNFQKIITAIYQSGVNDYELSRKTGVSRQRITQWRTGKRKAVDYDSGHLIINFYHNLPS